MPHFWGLLITTEICRWAQIHNHLWPRVISHGFHGCGGSYLNQPYMYTHVNQYLYLSLRIRNGNQSSHFYPPSTFFILSSEGLRRTTFAVLAFASAPARCASWASSLSALLPWLFVREAGLWRVFSEEAGEIPVTALLGELEGDWCMACLRPEWDDLKGMLQNR